MPNNSETKIFIIDDDELLLEMYATKFKEKGYEVKTAMNGQEALEDVDSENMPDAFLLDVVMPGIDGLELLKKLKSINGADKAAFIMLSNQGQDVDVEQARKLGADCYIVKASAIPSEVVERTAECLKKRK